MNREARLPRTPPGAYRHDDLDPRFHGRTLQVAQDLLVGGRHVQAFGVDVVELRAVEGSGHVVVDEGAQRLFGVRRRAEDSPIMSADNRSAARRNPAARMSDLPEKYR